MVKHALDAEALARTTPGVSDNGSDPFRLVTPEGSFVTEYVRYASACTDAPPAAHEMAALTVLSTLAGPAPRLPLATAADGWPLCLSTMYVVNSTVGRKTTVEGKATDVVEAVLGPDAVLSWEGSPQGLIQKLGDRNGQPSLLARDEISGLIAQMNRGGHLAGLEQVLIRAYDGLPLQNIRTRKRKPTGESVSDSDHVRSPYLTILAASTWDRFTGSATIDNVLSGFLARFAFYTGAAVPEPPPPLTDEIRAARERVLDRARRFCAPGQPRRSWTCPECGRVRVTRAKPARTWTCYWPGERPWAPRRRTPGPPRRPLVVTGPPVRYTWVPRGAVTRHREGPRRAAHGSGAGAGWGIRLTGAATWK